MIRCKNCRWWTGRFSNDASLLRACSHKQVGQETEAAFGSYDGEPFNGGSFASGPEFGCVHGEGTESARLRKSGDTAIKLTYILLWIASGLTALALVGLAVR